jgi:hypothetical protein
MKILISTLAVALALAFTGPAAFAGDVSKAKTEADCQKHGGCGTQPLSDSLVSAHADGYEQITYQPRGRSWFVLSGRSNLL